jgi:hypothetical protein
LNDQYYLNLDRATSSTFPSALPVGQKGATTEASMADGLALLGLVVAWTVVQAWVLPRLGVPS